MTGYNVLCTKKDSFPRNYFTKLKRNEWTNLPYNRAKDNGQKQYFTYLSKYDVQCVQTDKRRMHDKIPVILFSHTMPI